MRLNGCTAHHPTIDHIVTIDCARRLIFDCVEKYAIRLTRNYIRFSIGDDGYYLKIMEVTRIEKKQVGKSDWKKRRTNPETQKTKRT